MSWYKCFTLVVQVIQDNAGWGGLCHVLAVVRLAGELGVSTPAIICIWEKRGSGMGARRPDREVNREWEVQTSFIFIHTLLHGISYFTGVASNCRRFTQAKWTSGAMCRPILCTQYTYNIIRFWEPSFFLFPVFLFTFFHSFFLFSFSFFFFSFFVFCFPFCFFQVYFFKKCSSFPFWTETDTTVKGESAWESNWPLHSYG